MEEQRERRCKVKARERVGSAREKHGEGNIRGDNDKRYEKKKAKGGETKKKERRYGDRSKEKIIGGTREKQGQEKMRGDN